MPNPPAWRSGETHIAGSHPGGDPGGPGGEAFRAAAGLLIDQDAEVGA
jgi:hypothetical protein